MIKHKNAFAPFSLGSEGCIGKNREFKLLIKSMYYEANDGQWLTWSCAP